MMVVALTNVTMNHDEDVDADVDGDAIENQVVDGRVVDDGNHFDDGADDDGDIE